MLGGMTRHLLRPAAALLLAFPAASPGETVRVSSLPELRAAAAAAVPGTRIEIAAGKYAGGVYLDGLRGEKDRPIIITAADPKDPPRFGGGNDGIKLTNPFHLELSHLVVSDVKGNGVNIDDGGKWDPAPRGLILRALTIREAGPKGNFDGIKLSGLCGFRVEECVIENWGTGNGSGIDMVGCHDAVVTGCTLRHRADPDDTGASGVQMKGGCSAVTVRKNTFENAGARALNIGGSTGLPFFRPPLDQWPAGVPKSEARGITVEENTISGSGTAFAFVGVDGAVVRGNTVTRPDKWVMRILQETRVEGFVASRNGVFTDNTIIFQSARWGSGGVNIGDGTAPETFRFAGNRWYCEDQPKRSRPSLPVPEEGGVYGVAPDAPAGGSADSRK